MNPQCSKGFTLVELVIVIVLMSLVSLAGVEVIRQSSETYLKLNDRQSLTSAARLSVERLSREFRHALPGSVRVSGSCIEFLPITVAGMYLSAPIDVSASDMSIVSVATDLVSVTGRVAVYPVGANVYDLSTNILSPVASIGVPDLNNVSQLSWVGNHGFPFESPSRRFFLVSDPISYCLDGSDLFRYSDYGMFATQPMVVDLPIGVPQRALLVNQVDGPTAPFAVSDPGLTRNAIVRLALDFVEDGQQLQLTHEAQLRNVP